MSTSELMVFDACYSAHCVFLASRECTLPCTRLSSHYSFTQAWALKFNSPFSTESEWVLVVRGIPVSSPYSWKAHPVCCCLFLHIAPSPFALLGLLLTNTSPQLPLMHSSFCLPLPLPLSPLSLLSLGMLPTFLVSGRRNQLWSYWPARHLMRLIQRVTRDL